MVIPQQYARPVSFNAHAKLAPTATLAQRADEDGEEEDETVIVADALFVASLTDVALIVAEPAAIAVTRPVELTVAIAALLVDQVTPDPPLTVAVSCCVAPIAIVADAGDTATLTEPVGAVTVTVAVALLDGFAIDVAVILAIPTPTPVINPLLETVAIEAASEDQLTLVFDVPVTMAEICCVMPVEMFATDGASTIEIGTSGSVGPSSLAPDAPPQLAATRAHAAKMKNLLIMGAARS